MLATLVRIPLLSDGRLISTNNCFTEPSTTETTETKVPTTSAETVESKGPTSEQPSTTGDIHFKAAQADIRDPESTDPKKETERKNVDDSGAGLDESENPGKVDGPGPKPIEEVAAERGGDAANVGGAGSKGDVAAAGPEGAAEGEIEQNSKSKGSGEQYVKSSGLQADGGDFDATKPGAGREADRKSRPGYEDNFTRRGDC